MAKHNVNKPKKENLNFLWKGIDEDAFLNEGANITERDLADFDKSEVTLYMQNVAFFRHLPRLTDGLKPVERRILVACRDSKIFPDRKQVKSSKIVGEVNKTHPHGDCYRTAVNLAQYWKNPCPLLEGFGNIGNEASDEPAAQRYTEMRLSQYAYDCFVKDYDDDCVETLFNTASDSYEPLTIPCRFPNILVNGGYGVSQGFQFCIPPYNINDIVRVCKKLLLDENDPDIYIIPDLPTGCDIVDNGHLRKICDTGNGTLKLRSVYEIEEEKNDWAICIKNLPWGTTYDSFKEKLISNTTSGKLPIKDIQEINPAIVLPDGTIRVSLNVRIIISKAHDPYNIFAKMCSLQITQKSHGVNFNAVTNGLQTDTFSMRDLLLNWINYSREYKRRLLNKKISKKKADLSYLEIMLYLTEEDNLSKTINIIRNNTADVCCEKLMQYCEMSSYQAKRVVNESIGSFTSDAHDRYLRNRNKIAAEIDEIMKMIWDPNYIDDMIRDDLDDLMKYAKPRKSKIVEAASSTVVRDTDHVLVLTQQNLIKKLLYQPEVMLRKNTPMMGNFKNGDYPTNALICNNLKSVLFFDSNGKFSCIGVSSIEATDPSHLGNRAYDYTKLDGKIVTMTESVSEDNIRYLKDQLNADAYVITLTRNGYIKKTLLSEYTAKRTKNVRSMVMKDNDSVVYANIILSGANLLLYTEQGEYSYIKEEDISTTALSSMGVLAMNLEPNDGCKGIAVVGDSDKYVVVSTEKGCMKACEIEYLGKPGKRKVSSYLATLDKGDMIFQVNSVKEKDTLTICTRSSYQNVPVDTIPVKTRKAKADKMIPMNVGSNLVFIVVK